MNDYKPTVLGQALKLVGSGLVAYELLFGSMKGMPVWQAFISWVAVFFLASHGVLWLAYHYRQRKQRSPISN